jgi:DNA-binding MarR family transcriptional regulator
MVGRAKSTEGVRVTEQGGNEGGIDRSVVELAAEPVRYRVLAVLNERPEATPSRVATDLAIELEAAKTALDYLSEHGMAARTPDPVDGEPSYRALARALWTDEDLAELSVEERRRLHLWILGMVSADVERALASDSLIRNLDSHISRTVSTVDAQGWQELTQIQNDALGAVLAVEKAAAERLAERGEDGIQVLSGMLCCQLPDEQGRLPG